MPKSDYSEIFQKALRLNLDAKVYGTIAEIGAGQEVSRWFFRVGGASGTVAKTMSAYDKTVSDEIYGRATRFVSRERLVAMLEHEYALLRQRLEQARGSTTAFFSFADTVSARNYHGTNECHGWLGVRFQQRPMSEPIDIYVHVNLYDKENVLQQEALGILGVNLIYGACYMLEDYQSFLASLQDGLSLQRIEVDFVKVIGLPGHQQHERRTPVLLLNLGLTNAVLIGPDGCTELATEFFHKRPILIERGSFRSVNPIHQLMLRAAERHFAEDEHKGLRPVVALYEMTVNPIGDEPTPAESDFLQRLDELLKNGRPVLLSRYPEYYRVTTYLRRFTDQPIRFVTGVAALLQIFDERFYRDLPGGILEAMGRLLISGVRLYVFPTEAEIVQRMIAEGRIDGSVWSVPTSGEASFDNVLPTGQLRHLFAYLREVRSILGISPGRA